MISLMQGKIAWVVHVIGVAVTATALVYVSMRIFSSTSLLGQDFSNPSFLATLALGAAIYALFCISIGVAWVTLVDAGHGGTPLGFREGLIIFGRSQILKYLPSNVLHLVGRYGMARQVGIPHPSLLFSTLAEAGLLVVASATIAIFFALPLLLKYLTPSFGAQSPSFAVLVAFGTLGVVSVYWFGRKGLLRPKMGMALIVSFALYGVFFLLNGALLGGITWVSIGHRAADGYLFILGVAAAAWLGGFVVPGAPAGLGVREVLLTSGLEMAGFSSVALTVALGYRIIILGGDLMLALIAFLMPRR